MLELKVQRFREDLQQEETFEKLRERQFMIKDKFKKIVKKEELKTQPLFDTSRYNFRDWRDIVSQIDKN